MVINGLKSVNDAVSTMYKPAAGRLTPNKDEPKRYEACGSVASISHCPREKMVDNPAVPQHIYLARPAVSR
jgi:hypothetical protein